MLGSEEEQRAEAERLARTADHDAEVLGEFLKDFGLKGLQSSVLRSGGR